MATAYSAALRLGKPEVGADESTWGTILDAMVDMVDEAVGGYVSVALAGSNVTLTANNNATDQARNAVIKFTGTPGATRTVTAPDVEKTYWLINATTDGSALTFKTGAGTTVSVINGAIACVYCDGATNVVALYNGIDITQTQNATSVARLFNDSTGVAAAGAFALRNHNAADSGMTLYGSAFTTAGIARQDGLHISAAGAGGLTLNTTVAQPIYFGINSTLKLTLDTSGNLTNDSLGAQPAIDNHGNAAVRGDGCIHASKSAGVALEVNRTTDGTITNFRSAGSIQGSISIAGAVTSYNTSSDAAFKDDIKTASDVGHLIDSAVVSEFTWIATGEKQAAGFVAQDLTTLADSVPGLVNQREDGMLEYDPSKLVPLLFKEIQSLRARLAAARIP